MYLGRAFSFCASSTIASICWSALSASRQNASAALRRCSSDMPFQSRAGEGVSVVISIL